MILAERSAPPPALVENGEVELIEVLNKFEPWVEGTKYTFIAYKCAGVADALSDLFHGKCAYCESHMAAVMPRDIDHFRPKSAVLINGSLSKPGYYWLAAHWENLLPSCAYCNRPNRHYVLGEQSTKTRGKANQFPLADESKRARKSTDKWKDETPLLLDPCGTIEPREHLLFSSDGWVQAKPQPDGERSRIGAHTIDILALQRPDLVGYRHEKALRVESDFLHILQLHEMAETNAALHRIKACRIVLFDRYFEPSSDYVAVAKDVVEELEPDFHNIWPGILEEARRKLRENASTEDMVKAVGQLARLQNH